MSARKRYKPKEIVRDPVGWAITLATKLDSEQLGPLLQTMRDGIEDFRIGSGGPDPWRNLADCANIGEDLMRFGLANDHAATFTRAQLALKAVAERHAVRNSWTLRADELDALRLLVLVHEVQLRNCSQGEFRDAVKRVVRRVSAAVREGSATTIRVTGKLGTEGVKGEDQQRAQVSA